MIDTSRRRDAVIALILFAALALAPALAQALGAGYWISLLNRIMIFAIATLALQLALGFGGMVSFGHAAFVGIGAYMTGIAVQEGYGDVLIALPVTLLASAAFGAFAGMVSLKTRGVAFIMITLAFGQMAYFFAQSLYLYGGDDGLTLSGRLTVAGLPLLEDRVTFYYVTFAVLALAYLFMRRLVASRFGRALTGARDNATRMASLGYDVTAIRLIAFVISGMLASVAGMLLANQTEFVSPAYLAWHRSGDLIFMAIAGGVGSLWGAIAGAAAFLLAEEGLSHLTEHWKAIFGLAIILFTLLTQGGLAGLMERVLGSTRGERPHG